MRLLYFCAGALEGGGMGYIVRDGGGGKRESMIAADVDHGFRTRFAFVVSPQWRGITREHKWLNKGQKKRLRTN